MTCCRISPLISLKQGNRIQLRSRGSARREHIGVVFSGSIAVPCNGVYTFHLKSDDGSRLFVGRASLRLTSDRNGEVSKPQRITVGQLLNAEGRWRVGRGRGKVTLVRQTETGWQIELSAGAGHMLLEIGEAAGLSAETLLNARIRATGVCHSIHTADGQSVAGILLVPSQRRLSHSPPSDPQRDATIATDTNDPVLTTAGEVHRLKREGSAAGVSREDSRRGHVCFARASSLHDPGMPTRGLYVVDPRPTARRSAADRRYLKSKKARPIRTVRAVVKRVPGESAGWDARRAGETHTGSTRQWQLDAQQVELQGIVTAVHSNGLTILMRGGVAKIELRLAGQSLASLPQYENALVRIRGCLLASWDYVTHQVRMGDADLRGGHSGGSSCAAGSFFQSPQDRRRVTALRSAGRRFSTRESLRQIVHACDGEYFLMDGERACASPPSNRSPLKQATLWRSSVFPICSAARGRWCARPSSARPARSPARCENDRRR